METPAVVPRPVATRPNKTVTVFGASWCKPGDALYAEAEGLGRRIADAGFKLVNGGYAGTMEATAKGAASVHGAEVEGVVVPELFKNRPSHGNDYLTRAVPADSLLDRIQIMVQQSSYYVIMNGTLGTLTEAAIIWNIALLNPLAGLERPLILLYREPWEKLMDTICKSLGLGADVASCLRYIDSADEAVHIISEDYARRASSSLSGAGAV